MVDLKEGVPGAMLAALVSDVRTGGNEAGGLDYVANLMVVLGLQEALQTGWDRFGGLPPGHEDANVSARRASRLLGKNHGEVQPLDERDGFDTLVCDGGLLAHELEEVAIDGAEAFLSGDIEYAMQHRQLIIEKWNTFVDRHRVDEIPFLRLCEHCGRPLVFVARERTHKGLSAPAHVHPECRNAFKLAERRSLKRRARKSR
jgi:hypothetical protein